jgi:hypothetical protein
MIKCSKCNVEKTESNYYTYWHSTQQKMRIRKVCKPCFNKQKKNYKEKVNEEKIVQPVTPEPPTIDYSNDRNYHQCNECNEWLQLQRFYCKNGKPYSNTCKLCQKEIERQKAMEFKMENCGGGKVPTRPNKYVNNIQKECTFDLMRALGYLYDIPTGIWYKPGVKEIYNGKPIFLNFKNVRKTGRKVTPEVTAVICELIDRGLSAPQIAIKLELSITTIRKVMKVHGVKAH